MWKKTTLIGALAATTACSGSPDGDGGAEGSGGASNSAEGSSLLDVLLRHNELNVAGLEIWCELCGCAGIVGGEPEGRVCMDRVIREQHPSLVEPIRSYYECLIPIEEETLVCYQSAADCPTAEACGSAAGPSEGECVPADFETDAYAELAADLQTQCGDG